ncbi:MAG TPA: Holliday junction branch migration protein RuvA [Hydrogenispora sp.]|jgi:Holliday junction DNA helicase RuvA|nr:Holliday junction branch migration protein RuvA [Hydrogenispora sp.]
MIAFLSGTVKERSDEAVFIEVNGIGFRIMMATSALQQVRIGEKLLIHTYLSHKEDAMLLYGFLNQAEKALFIKLINVSGVGPKTALGILSLFSADQFCRAVLSEDVKLLSKAPGVGQKTAQRLILELKTTLAKEAEQFNVASDLASVAVPTGDDAVAALEALGYETVVAVKAVQTVRATSPELDLQEVIKRALRLLVKE